MSFSMSSIPFSHCPHLLVGLPNGLISFSFRSLARIGKACLSMRDVHNATWNYDEALLMLENETLCDNGLEKVLII